MTPASELIERVSRAIVVVRGEEGRGSGFFVDTRGIVVTNRHVVQDARSVVLELFDKSRVSAQVVRAFQSPDLAFLLTTSPTDSHPSLPFAEDATVRPGMDVFAIGHPGVGDMEFAYSVAKGIVAGLSRRVRGAMYLQTDAAINPGNSGGPLIDTEGRVVGMSTLAFIDKQNLNFAVPASAIRGVLASLSEHISTLHEALYCPVCGESNSQNAHYCVRCGQSFARLPSESLTSGSTSPKSEPTSERAQQCLACGRETFPSSPYCAACGARYDRAIPGGTTQ